MRSLVITDIDVPVQLFHNSVVVHLNNMHYHECTGGLQCFRNNGVCRYHDDMSIITKWSNDCQLIIYISKVIYGSFDVPFKSFLERYISNYEPFYSIEEGETTHISLSQHKRKLLVLGYGNLTDDEEKLFRDYLNDFSLMNNYKSIDIYTCKEEEIEETLKLFGGVDHG